MRCWHRVRPEAHRQLGDRKRQAHLFGVNKGRIERTLSRRRDKNSYELSSVLPWARGGVPTAGTEQSADGYVAWLSEASKVVRKAARYATVTGLWREAASITEARLGSDHPDVVTCLNNLAGLLHDQGDFTEAQRLFARALAGC